MEDIITTQQQRACLKVHYKHLVLLEMSVVLVLHLVPFQLMQNRYEKALHSLHSAHFVVQGRIHDYFE